MDARREAIKERYRIERDTFESKFQDDSDSILLLYDVFFSQDLPIEIAVRTVEQVLTGLDEGREQILSRHFDSRLQVLGRGRFDSDFAAGLT
jgi:hypothetical protein